MEHLFLDPTSAAAAALDESEHCRSRFMKGLYASIGCAGAKMLAVNFYSDKTALGVTYVLR
jgi:hypothetical protein